MATGKFVAEVTGQDSGSKVVTGSWTITTPINNIITQTLSTGDNTITWPSGATVCIIAPDPGETETLTLKGAGGDTGVTIASTQPVILTKGSAGSFIVTAGGNTSAVEFNFI